MSGATVSVLAYGIYLAALGVVYMIVPNVPLQLFGFQPTTEPWIRVMAAMVVIVGYYYIQAARHRLTTFYRWTLHCRAFFSLFVVVLVVTGLVEPMLLLFGAIDLAGAVWTGLALEHVDGKDKEKRPMDLEIADETRAQTTRCPHDFACLRDAQEQVCPPERHVEGNGLFVHWQGAWSCPYHLAFGDGHICHCPTRIAVYRLSGS